MEDGREREGAEEKHQITSISDDALSNSASEVRDFFLPPRSQSRKTVRGESSSSLFPCL